jgi:hypothetical protein
MLAHVGIEAIWTVVLSLIKVVINSQEVITGEASDCRHDVSHPKEAKKFSPDNFWISNSNDGFRYADKDGL